MRPEIRSESERRLGKLFRSLDVPSRDMLLAFAEFLATRRRDHPARALPPSEPQYEPRPPQESVVAAIKRLRRTYPMLDGGTMLSETSALMAAHVLQGREAETVIDELESLFASRFDAHNKADGE